MLVRWNARFVSALTREYGHALPQGPAVGLVLHRTTQGAVRVPRFTYMAAVSVLMKESLSHTLVSALTLQQVGGSLNRSGSFWFADSGAVERAVQAVLERRDGRDRRGLPRRLAGTLIIYLPSFFLLLFDSRA